MRFSLVFLYFFGFAGLTVFLGSGCGNSGTEGPVGFGGSAIAGGSISTGGTSGGVGGAGSGGHATGGVGSGAGGGGGAGGGLGGIQADVALGGAGGSGGLDLGEDGNGRGEVTGTGGVVGESGTDGTGGIMDGGLDGAGGETPVDAACINLGDIPSVQIMAADSSVQIRSLDILSGPCTSNLTMSAVEFYYWEKGYSCPSAGNTVTCKVEVTSSLGSVAMVTVGFSAVGLGSQMLYWQPQPLPKVSFPPLDGAVGE